MMWKQKAERWLRNPGRKEVVWFFVYIMQLSLALAMLSGLSVLLLGAGEPASKNHNSFCLDNIDPSVKNSSVILDGKYNGSCAFDYNFKKVIFFWLDGVSWDTADPIFNQFPETNIYKLRHKENPWSAWVFATVMTGKPNRNMGVIKNDNLIYQFDKAGMKMRLGVEETVAYVGYAIHEFVGDNIKFFPGVKNDDASSPKQMYDWFFKCGTQPTPELCANNTLNELNANDESLYLESFSLDHEIHFAGHNKYDDYIHEEIEKFTVNLQHVKNWVDDHPEYLLVVLSDHGQKVSTSDSLVHGDFLKEGNEGWVITYNPQITTVITRPSTPIILQSVDVLPTLWQFFAANGVSLPAENIGVAYPISNNAQTMYKLYSANFAQMVQYATNARVFKGDLEEDVVEALTSIHENAAAGNYERATFELQELLKMLSAALFASYMNIDMMLPVFVLLKSLVLALLVQFGFSRLVLATSLRSIGIGMALSAYFTWLALASLFEHPNSVMASSAQVLAYTIAMFAFLASNVTQHLPSPPPASKDEDETEPRTVSTIELKSMDDSESENGYSLFQNDLSTVPLTAVITTDIPIDSSGEIPIYAPPQPVSATVYTTKDSTKPTFADEAHIESIYTCTHMLENAKIRGLKDTLISYFNYIVGQHKTTPSPPEYWVRWFFITFVCFAGSILAFPTKTFLIDDVAKLHFHPKFWKTLVLFTVFLEFRWQRILLTSHLKVPVETTRRFCWQLTHPAFIMLNVKTVVYSVLILLSMRDNISHNFAFALFYFLFIHTLSLVFFPSHFQRDLALPIFTLLIFLSNAQERIYLSLFFICMHFISNTLTKKIYANQHIVPSLVLVMVMMSHFYFAVIGKSLYEMKLADAIPGIEDATVYPVLSVFLMGVHNFGYFILLVPFIIRLVNAVPTFGLVTFRGITVGYKVDASSPRPNHIHRNLAGTLLLFFTATCVVFFYLFVKLRSLSDTCMLWAATTLIVCILYFVTLVGSELYPMGKKLVVTVIPAVRKVLNK